MNKNDLLNLVGEFTWMFGREFFIETSEGNFIWRDPDYQGDNTIRSYSGTLSSYLHESHIPYGRDKGKHLIREYCGEDISLVDSNL